MKSTQYQPVPTDFVVTIQDTLPSSFVATNKREIVLTVEMGERGTGTVGRAGRRIGQEASENVSESVCGLVTRLTWTRANSGRKDVGRESLEIDREANGNLRISAGFHNRWLLFGFQLLTIICVLFSGRITLGI